MADESIVIDENNYFAHLDVDKLKLNLSANNEQSQALIDTCTKAFERVYTMFGWDKSNGAWNTFKKFLIEGYIAFEIIYDNKKLMNELSFITDYTNLLDKKEELNNVILIFI